MGGLSQCPWPELTDTAGFLCRCILIRCIHLSNMLSNGGGWGFSKLRPIIMLTTYMYFKDWSKKAALVEGKV